MAFIRGSAGPGCVAEQPPPPQGRSWAVAAFLALLSALWLPWYIVRNVGPNGEVYEELTAGAFRPGAVAEPVLVHVASALVAAAAVLLFVRVAGQSWKHEPAAWRRDLANGSALAAAAAVLVAFWPDAFPSFWGTLHYTTDGGDPVVVTTPGLGWFLVVAGALLAAVAAWSAHRARDVSTRPPANGK